MQPYADASTQLLSDDSFDEEKVEISKRSLCCFSLYQILSVPTFGFLAFAYFKDNAGMKVKTGEMHECTSFPVIFILYFALFLLIWFTGTFIFLSYCMSSARTSRSRSPMKTVIGAIAVACLISLVLAPVELFTRTEECKRYIRDTGGSLFWLACEVTGYMSLVVIIVSCCVCFNALLPLIYGSCFGYVYFNNSGEVYRV